MTSRKEDDTSTRELRASCMLLIQAVQQAPQLFHPVSTSHFSFALASLYCLRAAAVVALKVASL